MVLVYRVNSEDMKLFLSVLCRSTKKKSSFFGLSGVSERKYGEIQKHPLLIRVSPPLFFYRF